MARENDSNANKGKTRPVDLMVSGLSVASAFAVFNFAWNFRSSVESVVKEQAHVLRPSREYIQSACEELLREERKRASEEHAELREAINWIMRYIGSEKGRR